MRGAILVVWLSQGDHLAVSNYRCSGGAVRHAAGSDDALDLKNGILDVGQVEMGVGALEHDLDILGAAAWRTSSRGPVMSLAIVSAYRELSIVYSKCACIRVLQEAVPTSIS